MDKKFLIRMLLLNTAWVVWIALSILFGCLIADAYFPDNIAMFIPFSLIFIAVVGVVAFVIYRVYKKKKGAGENTDIHADFITNQADNQTSDDSTDCADIKAADNNVDNIVDNSAVDDMVTDKEVADNLSDNDRKD